MKILLFSIINFCILFTISAAELPQQDKNVHLGVASCAASMCHGSVVPRQGSDVLQNEYIIWSREDAHSQAYQTLLSAESKNIAAKLGLDNAAKAGICLDCHSDNVKAELQGEKFQISDGVGCESCHGGAQNYISSHTSSTVSRESTLSDGLFPTDKPKQRARLCLSCHLGNKNKQATHDIMGAGHPRLAFELDTFGILQPLHYVVDEDYRTQKWSGDSYVTWVYGQLEASKSTLRLIESKLINNNGLFPELSLFDCHSCHHPMSDLKWTATKGQGFKPGTVRLNDGNFKMLMVIASRTELFTPLHQHLTELRNGLNNKSQLQYAIAKVMEDIDAIQNALETQSLSQRQASASFLLNKIVTIGADGEFSDYIAAEQAVMAIDLLFDFTGKKSVFASAISQLFDIVADDEKYNAQLFSQKLNEINKRITKK
ncbi:hypothetical protein A3Q34_16285 [Colwellia sp. PAMC 20917]|uniref:multiheme c-type cytochrome n=1 Tax=Colwellia sp. PAMC 20917 TaxID=1816218 RepID=UPI000878B346|nr:multiheme c-type cytochrome [Colwellia sp. PAMC 20917]AOW78263.1 hypothetical protein A3Q34_16285 [Colwellia sp. PAMC 20917]